LNLGLAVVLVFVGLKMMLADVYHLNEVVSLGVIVGVLTTAVVGSLLNPEPTAAAEAAQATSTEEAVEKVADDVERV
ncbi:MAG TPA: hypothetical protein VNT23_05200, partial [Gaiellaceae bacterium]|nr:hypothetical protein [Gaiellaceae bacterium]